MTHQKERIVQDHYYGCVYLLYGTKPPNKESDEETKHWQLNVFVLVPMKLCCKVHVQCCNVKQEDPAEYVVSIKSSTEIYSVNRRLCYWGMLLT